MRFIVHKSTKVMWIRISLFSFDSIVCSDSLMQIHIKILIIRQGSIKCPCFFSNQQQLQLLFIIIFYLLIHLQLWKTIIHIVLGIKKSLVCKPSSQQARRGIVIYNYIWIWNQVGGNFLIHFGMYLVLALRLQNN